MTKYRSIYGAILLSALVTSARIANAAATPPPAYHVADLGTLGHEIFGPNNSGQLTGSYTTSYTTGTFHAFVYDGTMHDLGTLGPSYIDSEGLGINDSGQVAGTAYSTDRRKLLAFLWTPTTPNGASGTMHGLGTLGGMRSSGEGINDSGQVTGFADTTEGIHHAFLWKPTTPNGVSGMMHDLGSLGPDPDIGSVGNGINASGQVTGESGTTTYENHAFLWTPTTPNGVSGTMHDLGTLGGTHSRATGISASGQVVGVSDTSGDAELHAFLWTPTTPNGVSGTMIDLGPAVDRYGGVFINASGQVVGLSYTTGQLHDAYPFLYTSGSGMVDLNTLIDPLSGWELVSADGINDAGQITGYGQIGGEYHAFLLTPVPEPATWLMLVLGTPLFARRRLGKRSPMPTRPVQSV